MSGAAMDNPVSSINVKVSPIIVDNNQWSYQTYPWTIHGVLLSIFFYWTDKLINVMDKPTRLTMLYACA